MSTPSAIVVRSPNWIGDHVMARSFYRGIRRCYPKATVVLLAPTSILGLEIESEFDDIVPMTPGEWRSWRGQTAIVRRLRSKIDSVDLGVSLSPSASAALLLWRLGARHRVAFTEIGGMPFLTSPIPWPGREGRVHKSVLMESLLSHLTGKSLSTSLAALSILGEREPLIVVAPGAALPLREWPYFPELLEALEAQYPSFAIQIVGSPGESKWSSRLARLSLKRSTDRIGQTTLKEVLDLCRRASLVIANDSGIAHVAATLAEAPTLVLMGPGAPNYIQPTGPNVTVCRVEELGCSPCESTRCRGPFGYQACLKRLNSETVFQAAQSRIDKLQPGLL